MKLFVNALAALILPLTAQAQRGDLRAIRAAQNLAADLKLPPLGVKTFD